MHELDAVSHIAKHTGSVTSHTVMLVMFLASAAYAQYNMVWPYPGIRLSFKLLKYTITYYTIP